MTGLAGRRALVTGASGGTGFAIVRGLRAAGARVAVADRDVSALEAEAHLPGDLLDRACSDGPRLAAPEVLGGLDILVNNAGAITRGSVAETSDADQALSLVVNAEAPLRICRAPIPIMSAAGGGAIVNVGSIKGLGSNPWHAACCASRAGLHRLTRTVAVDHGGEGIRCNAVAPGWIDTDLNAEIDESMPDPKAFRGDIGRIHPIGRTGRRPGEVASLVAWLASEKAGLVTGQVRTVDGGRMTRLSLP